MAARPLLIIDDDAALADLLASILADDGYAVEAATSQQEALQLFATRGPQGYCLVLSDSFSRPLSEMFVWLDQIRTRTAAPVVIVSAHPASVFAGWAERGFAAVLPKPFDIEALSALVRLLCGAPDGHG